MKSTSHHFADLTALLEDMHGIAVEGQAGDCPDDVKAVLLRQLYVQMRRQTVILGSLYRLLQGASRS
jgi:hypothetical protein